MAYQFLVPASISDLVNAVGVLATANGWQLITQDNNVPVLGAVTSNSITNPRTRVTVNNLSLLSIARAGNIGRTSGTIVQAALTGTRLVLKDPNGAYFHLFGYDNLTGWIDGQSAQSLSFLELWISDEFSGVSDPPLQPRRLG